MFAQGYLWYGLPKTSTSPPKKVGRFLLSKPRVDEVKTDLLVSNGDMVPANQSSRPTSWVFNIERNAPIN